MMSHPIHLHGHFFELVTGKGDRSPRKHTVLVQPGGTASFDFTADAVGDWAFHCHLLYHMHAGLMEVVRELAVTRRERRATDVHWFDRLYNAYLTIIGCGMTVIVAITFVGTDEVSEATMRRVAAD